MNEDDLIVTTVRLDRATWDLLSELARLRAARLGGRPSQSAVVRELVNAAAEAPRGATKGNA